MGRMTTHILWKIKNVPNHQPDTHVVFFGSLFSTICPNSCATIGTQCFSATWWLIPLSKWVITPVISGLTLLIPCQSLGLRFVGSSPPSKACEIRVQHEKSIFVQQTSLIFCRFSSQNIIWL